MFDLSRFVPNADLADATQSKDVRSLNGQHSNDLDDPAVVPVTSLQSAWRRL